MRRRGLISLLLATMGLAVIADAVQIRTWHGRGSWAEDPSDRLLAATWLATEIWVHPWLLLVGVAAVVAAVVSFVRHRRHGRGATEPHRSA
jgi:hypothetical protein